MTKISVYNIDEYVTADDKWIGTDVNTYNKTKNFTPRKLSNYFNGSQVINTGVDLLYKYFTITPPETRPTGTLSFETEIGQTVNFSAISTFLLSKTTLKGNDVVEFLNFLVGTKVLLYKAKNINLFGNYNIVSVEEYLPEPNFLVVNVEFIDGNGFIEEDEDYMISLIDISGGGGTQNLQEVTDEGAATTNSITVDSLGYYSLVSPDAVGTEDKTTGSYAFLGAAGLLGLKNGAVDSILKNTNVTNNNIVLEFPDKPTGSYTIATTLDSPITIVNDSSLFSTGLIGTGDGATNANYSNFLGDSAGYEATNASDSNFLGSDAGREATDANNSNFFGPQAGLQATAAEKSNFIGDSAGYQATNANNSNFIGTNTGYTATNANYSNFIGNGAGNNATDAYNSNFLGYQAGRNATDANHSNLLGYNAGSSFADNNIGSNNIIIGTNISLPDATANSLNIGGILFGTGTYSENVSDTPSITPTLDGKIGIGVVEPTNTLHIYSEAEDTSGLRLERLTSASPISTGQAIGVDASGNIVTVEGGGGGSQNLQQVTDIGANTTNGISIDTEDTYETGLYAISSAIGIKGESREYYGVYGSSSSSAGVYGIGGIGVYGESTNGNGVEGVSVDGNAIYGSSANVIGVYARSDYGTGLYSYSESGVGVSATSNSIGLEVNGNGTIAIEANLGNSNKGLVINSGTSSTGNFIELDKNGVDKLVVNQAGELTAQKLIKEGGFDYQFLKADGSVDNNIYLTSADLPSTLDLYATTTASDISGYTVLVRNIADTRYNTTAVDVSTGVITSVGQLVGSLITDANIISGNPGVFDFKTIGNISRTNGTGQAEFFFRIYKRNLAGTETLIAESDYTLPVTNGGYVEFSATALWNDGIFLETDRVVLKYYANRLTSPVGSDPTYKFQFGGTSPVRSSAAIPTSVMPNIYLRDLADVENVDALNNEILYWNDPASLWEHSLAEDLVPLATATQKGLVSTTTQTFAGDKTFTGGIISNTILASSTSDIAISAVSQDSDAISAESVNGIGVFGSSVNGLGGYFNTVNGANIAEFRTNFVEKAKIDSDGLITGTGLNASDQTANTIASFDGAKSVVSLPTATYPSLTELALVKGVTGSSIQTQLDSKVDENTAITGDTKTKITYDSKGLVTAGADIATTDISDFNSATRAQVEAELVAGTNITITPSGTGATRQLTIASSGGGSSSQSAFTMLANNTNASAVPTEQPFQNLTNQVYSGTIIWNLTAPTVSNHTYSLSQIGNLVTLTINLAYSTQGSPTLSLVAMELPSTAPAPALPSSVTTALDIISYGTGGLQTNKTFPATPTVVNCALRIKSTGVYEIVVARTAAAYKYAYATIQYFV